MRTDAGDGDRSTSGAQNHLENIGGAWALSTSLRGSFFFVLLAAAVVIALELAALPGKIAAKRKHPGRRAVNVAGWITFFWASRCGRWR